jgi:hypothetical protein
MMPQLPDQALWKRKVAKSDTTAEDCARKQSGFGIKSIYKCPSQLIVRRGRVGEKAQRGTPTVYILGV